MQPLTNQIITATRKASRLIQRDFFELEHLQTSNRGTIEFCNKSLSRTQTILKEELSKNNLPIFFSHEKVDLPTPAPAIMLVNILDGHENFMRALPFFSISVTFLKRIDNEWQAMLSVLNFPALGEICYAEKGGGAWLDRITDTQQIKAARMRSSNNSNLNISLAVANNYNDLDLLKSIGITEKNFRHYSALSYSACLLAMGKIDIIHLGQNHIMLEGLKLIITEAGGFLFGKNNIIASNYPIAEKFKQELTKITN